MTNLITSPPPGVIRAIGYLGAEAGRTAAEWWAQHTIGGRASGDTRRTAEVILAGIDDGDPAVLDSLPYPEPGAAARAYPDLAFPCAATWPDLGADIRRAFTDTYLDAYTDAATHHIGVLCRQILEPASPDEPDLAGGRA